MPKNVKFSSFVPGGQVLTNIEEYYQKVSAEADLYAEKVKAEADLYKQSQEEAAQESVQKRTLAEAEAAEIIAKAKQEAETLLEKSQSEGYAAGMLEAEKTFQNEIGDRLDQLTLLLDELKNFRSKLYLEYEQKLLDLVLLIVKRLLNTEIKTNPKIVLGALQKTAAKISSEGKVRIFINPADYAYLAERSATIKDYFDNPANFALIKDENIMPGSSRIESDYSSIENYIEHNLKNIEEELKAAYNQRSASYSTPLPQQNLHAV